MGHCLREEAGGWRVVPAVPWDSSCSLFIGHQRSTSGVLLLMHQLCHSSCSCIHSFVFFLLLRILYPLLLFIRLRRSCVIVLSSSMLSLSSCHHCLCCHHILGCLTYCITKKNSVEIVLESTGLIMVLMLNRHLSLRSSYLLPAY